MATQIHSSQLDEIEQFTRINQMQADTNRKQQEIKLAPWQLTLTAMGAGAALLAAGAALTKIFIG